MRYESRSSVQTTMGQRALCMLLSAILASSSLPTAAVQAIADELSPEDEITEELVPLEGPEDEAATDAGVDAESAPEPEPQDESEPDAAPTAESDPQAADPEPEAVSQATTEQPEAQSVEDAPVTVSTKARRGIVPATDSVSLTAIGPDGTPLEDGSYLAPDVLLKVAGSNISDTELPTVTLTYKDINGKTHTKSYALSNDDAENPQWLSGGGVYVATVHVNMPGTYVSASISGGSCFYDGSYVELKGSVDFSPQFRVAGVELAEIIMLDKDDNKIVDDSDQVIDLLDVTSKTVVDPEIIQVRLAGKVDITRSMVALIDHTGTYVSPAAFEEDAENPGTFIAKLKGYTDSSTIKKFQDGYYAIMVHGEDELGNWLRDDEGNSDVVLFGKKEEQEDGTELHVPDGKLLVDRTSPDVIIQYPHDEVASLYTPEVTAETAARVADVPAKIDFFRGTAQVEITITDFSLDEATTTVFGTTLSQLFVNPTEAIEGIPCTVTTSTTSNGAKELTIAAQCGEGLYDVTKLVSAKDTVKGHAATEPDHLSFDGSILGITHFVVDATAPQVTTAQIGFAPYDLGTDAGGNPIDNGAENNGNRVYFVAADRGINPTSLRLEIDEPYGIRSVELLDTSKNYVNYIGGFDAALQAGNATITEATHDTYKLTVINCLVEGRELPDDVFFVITDFAGNQYYWSMAEVGFTGTTGTGVLNPTINADLMHDTNVDGIYTNPMLHPTLLVPDQTEPVLTVTGPADRTDADAVAGYERFFSLKQDLSLTLTEANLHYLLGFTGGNSVLDPHGFVTNTFAGLDPNRPVLTYTFTPNVDGASSELRAVCVKDLNSPTIAGVYAWMMIAPDGHYSNIKGAFTDVVGLSSTTSTIADFTVDTTAPELVVVFDKTVSGGFGNQGRTATITVIEHNFDPALFNIDITMDAVKSGTVMPAPTAWVDDPTDGDVHTCKVSFPDDGTFTLKVSGKDKAGNKCDAYDSGTFTIDSEAPIVAKYYANGAAPASTFDVDAPVAEFSDKATGTFDDGSGIIQFFTHAVSVDVKVQDRNFDVSKTTLSYTKDGVEASASNTWNRYPTDPSARGTNGYELYQTSVNYTEDGVYTAPHVVTTDKAGNASDNATDAKAHSFVIDLKAPTITVAVDRDPSAQGTSGSADPYNFYNQATKMTFTVSDEHLLRSAQLDDPSGQYTISASEASAEGKGSVVLTASLKDGTAAQDAEFQRDIVLTAVDLAGNRRTWTIDHTGTVVLDEVSSTENNEGINGGTVHPQALIQDTVAPVVSLSGVTAGSYYNTPQTVEATIEELNFDYLQTFDAGRGVITVTTYASDAGRAQSTTTVAANDFSGARPTYHYSQSFATDGHYELSAQFRDYAGNLSNQATIGEFTIDTTAPVIEVTWDNEDVRNEKYYKATRTATVTVNEHNFDEGLMNIETTGSVSGWSASGDAHTCTVSFGEGSAHTLTVRGADLAGNDAGVFTEPEFVVDLTEPELEIAGTAQRLGYLGDESSDGLVNAYHGDLEDKSAYNGVVVPVITYKDNEPLSSEDLTYTVSGTKHGEEVELEAATSEESKEMTTTFRDLGYVGPDSGDGSNWEDFYVDDYAVDADDIYTIKATMTDQAGNEAEAEITFSVNRYGSNYVVNLQGLDADEQAEYAASGMLWEAPTIVVREVNVSGVESQADHLVQKEFANVTTAIAQSDGAGAGYALEAIEGESQEHGWSEYVYTIRSANFGAGSDSDNNDRGQGQYRVNVMSDDRSSNANSTAAYWGSDNARTQAIAAGATTQFVLDEVGPAIDDVNLPEGISRGESFEASFHVTDDITSGNVVRVYVDGQELSASELNGPVSGVGTFTFNIPAKAFDWSRSVRIVVTDYAGRMAETTNEAWMWQSSFIPEAAAGAGVVAIVVAGVMYWRRRKAAEEPELI